MRLDDQQDTRAVIQQLETQGKRGLKTQEETALNQPLPTPDKNGFTSAVYQAIVAGQLVLAVRMLVVEWNQITEGIGNTRPEERIELVGRRMYQRYVEPAGKFAVETQLLINAIIARARNKLSITKQD